MFWYFSISIIRMLYIECNIIYYFLSYISNLLIKLFFLKKAIDFIAMRGAGFNLLPRFAVLLLILCKAFFSRVIKVVGKTQ